MAPLALAKAVHNVYPGRRNAQSLHERRTESRDKRSLLGLNNGIAGFGITDTTITEVIIIWVNPGAGALTTTINQQLGGVNTIGIPGAIGTASPVAAPGIPGQVIAAPGAQTTHQVTVGGPTGLQFSPSEIKAAIGDMVIFTFLGNNHTATQSAFDTPCEPLAGGMDSGFQANADSSLVPPPQVAMQVMVDTPLWFFCRQANHCGKGMTFSINPTADKTHAMFQAMAIAQRGNGAGTAITGGQPAAAPPPAPAAGAPLPPPVDLASPTLGLLPGETAAAANPIGVPGGIATGTGQFNPDGSCTCAVVCGAGSFPAVDIQGVGGFGGMPG